VHARLAVLGAIASAFVAYGCSTGPLTPNTASRVQNPSAADVAATPVRADNFMLVDADLQAHELYRLSDAKAVVLVTQTNGDAVIRREAATLHRLEALYAGKGVEFLMLNSSPADSREAIQAEAQRVGYETPVLMDSYQLVGESLGVTRSAEVILIDPKTWQVVWRGALADDAAAGKAIENLAAGRGAAVASTAPGAGAAIRFRPSGAARISYAKDVAPILEAKCVACHEEGGIGPFAMKDYAAVKGFAPMIREVLRTDRMPPYNADPHVGTFSDDKNLSSDEVRTIVHWVEAGAPRGDGADPLAAARRVAQDWTLGKPDLVFKIPAYKVPASGVVEYQRPWVANAETEGHWLRATAVKPGERQAVHHVLSGWMKTAPRNGRSSESNWRSSMGRYAVGAEPDIFDPDVGVYLPPGGAIGFQMHYTPFGREVVDSSQIGVYFRKTPPKYILRQTVISDPTIDIPPNAAHHMETAYVEFPKDALLYDAFVHAHYRATASDLWLQTPDGRKTLLLALPRYDFNWQRAYTFAKPVKIPAGSKLVARYWYDNSKRNPANPDPSIEVTWGEQSFQEMLFTQVDFRWMDETAAKQIDSDARFDGVNRLLGFLDDNVDGKLQKAELRGPFGRWARDNFEMLDTDHDGGLDKTELAPVIRVLDGHPSGLPAARPAAAAAAHSR